MCALACWNECEHGVTFFFAVNFNFKLFAKVDKDEEL